MCGISGIMYMNSGRNGAANVGSDLVKMLDALAHRGRDSTGFTVVGEQVDEDLIVRLWTEDTDAAELVLSRVEEAIGRVGGVVVTTRSWGGFFRLTVNYEGEVSRLAETLMNTDGVVIHSIGEASEVVKDVGVASDMDRTHHIGRMRGTHGIGHVRMATESKVDITHSHPFWAYPFHRRYRRPQRPADELPQAQAALPVDGSPVPHGERLRVDRRVPRRQAGGG